MIRLRPMRFSSQLTRGLFLAAFALAYITNAAAQDAPAERIFRHSKPEIEKAAQALRNSSSGRLPFLDGFVGGVEQPLDRFERAYYQCSVQITPRVTGDAIVRVTAKITAWYASPNPAEAGYRALPSNGRLENDLLDRLAEALDGKPSPPPIAPSAVPSPGPAVASPRPNLKLDIPSPNVRIYGASSAAPSAPPSATPPAAAPSGEAKPSAPSSPAEEETESLGKQREASEKRMQQLNTELQSLLEIQRTQAYPKNLAIVRKSGTPVLAKPQEGARVLFAADLHDEFEILDLEPNWVHVQISGPSRGWIRRVQLDLPEGFLAPFGKPASPGAAPSTETPLYQVLREESGLFPSKWEPLQGKTVKIIWMQPAAQPLPLKDSSAQARRLFAKSLFWKALAEPPAATPIAGVVLILDAADGGEAAATLATLQQWKSGTLSDEAFWQQCYLDPPEAFRDPAPR
ncbi:MAG: hypothetical protein LAN71_13065 [Acidobacteriia bacterium]|nr:hypothetical protein [Terriglobia bacterium]